MDVLIFIRWFLAQSWDFFTKTPVPGFTFSFAALFVGLFLAVLSLRFLSYMFGFGGLSSSMLLGLRSGKEKADKK